MEEGTQQYTPGSRVKETGDRRRRQKKGTEAGLCGGLFLSSTTIPAGVGEVRNPNQRMSP